MLTNAKVRRLPRHSRHFGEALNAHERSFVHLFEPKVGEDTVLVGDRHNVGRNGHSEELQDRHELPLVPAFVPQPRQHQFVSDSAAGKPFIGVGTVLSLHIEYGDGIGNSVARGMVVADNEVDMVLVGVLHFVHLLDAAVERDNERALLLYGIVHALVGDAVALCVAVGYVVEQVVQAGAQYAIDERYSGCAVHVVVAVDEDTFLIAYRPREPLHGFVHIAHPHGVVLPRERGTYIVTRRIGRRDAPVRQEFGRGKADIQLLSECGADGECLLRRRPCVPMCVHRSWNRSASCHSGSA